MCPHARFLAARALCKLSLVVRVRARAILEKEERKKKRNTRFLATIETLTRAFHREITPPGVLRKREVFGSVRVAVSREKKNGTADKKNSRPRQVYDAITASRLIDRKPPQSLSPTVNHDYGEIIKRVGKKRQKNGNFASGTLRVAVHGARRGSRSVLVVDTHVIYTQL